MPAGTSPGFHTVDVTGKNSAGETIDVSTIVYVADSGTDYDGDGIPNSSDQCLITPLSGHDIDQDGIDDACDPFIGNPPVYSYPVTVKLTGNYITFGP